ncbi:MAG: tRNA 2-thiouridine(34) synthase MnmA, partial [Solirubrobacterales bacterium]|nr:tRNA 2-thiouridine(34) synthase MnmA [Solirubrobacterales bacterium]
AAALAEEIEGMPFLDAARTTPANVAELLGGLSAQGRHASELAADALHRALGGAAASGEPLAPTGSGEPTLREGEHVAVALSGGVDSAVAALLERERGAEVVAVTVKLWADQRTDAAKSCCSPLAVLGARELAHSLGMPHVTLDLEQRFRREVVGGFVAGHRAGRTPNPCVLCNGSVRIDAMLELATRLGASSLATGHYARLERFGDEALLAAPADDSKDQTYMLSGVSPRTLGRMSFPLAELRKARVRALAAEAGLMVATKSESQDLCFLAGEGKRSFLARHGGLADRSGELRSAAGELLGVHAGYHHFTVGQRRGIGIAGPEPLYVLRTDAAANRVTVGTKAELATRTVRVRDAVLYRDGGRVDRVRLRYRSAPIECAVSPDVDEGSAPSASGRSAAARAASRGPAAGPHPRLRLELAEPAHGVAPGQTACLMEGELVVGRATIAP